MVETQTNNNERESIALEYTAKGFANWTIKLRDDVVTSATIERLEKLDKEMRTKFQINVMNGLGLSEK